MSVINDRLAIRTIPAVQLDTATAFHERSETGHANFTLVVYSMMNLGLSSQLNNVVCKMHVLYVSLSAAGSFDLVLRQVCVVRGRDEVMVERLVHVLVNAFMGRVKDQALGLVQVH